MRSQRAAATKKPTTPTRSKSNGLAGRIKPVKDIKKNRSWVFYGRSGTGKTTLASTFPGPILLVDIKDEGTDSVSDVKGLDVLEVESTEDLEELYWMLKENPSKYKTVILDTVTQLQNMRVEEVSDVRSLKGKSAGDWGTMTQKDWGLVSSWMKKTITDFRSLPLEVVFIAQDRVFNAGDEEENAAGAIDPEVGPRLSPATMAHLCSAVHMIGNTFIREKVTKKKVDGKTKETRSKEYCIRLGPSSYYITKLRKPKDIALPEFLANPTYEDILEIVTGE